MASTWAAMFSARPCARYSASAWMTLDTPAIWAAAAAAGPALWPAISTCTSPPHWAAAATVLSVAPLMVALSCSAMTSAVMFCVPVFWWAWGSDDLRLVLELFDESCHIRHLDARTAFRRLADLQGLDARGNIHTEVFGLDDVHLLLLGLHDVGQRHVARLVQAQVGGDDGRQRQAQGFQTAVDFTGHVHLAVDHLDLAGESALRQVGQGGEHLAGLVAVVVNGLFAQDHEAGLFLVHQRLEQLGHGQGLQFFGGFHQDGAVRADGHGRAQGFLALGHAAGDGDDFGDDTLLLQAHGFFHRDLVKRVHAHLDVGQVHAGLVCLDAHLDVVVHHAFDGDDNLHIRLLLMVVRTKEKAGFELTYTSIIGLYARPNDGPP